MSACDMSILAGIVNLATVALSIIDYDNMGLI